MNNLQMTFLDIEDTEKTKQEPTTDKLDVVHVAFQSGQRMTWKDLFKGYDSLFAITYSSGIEFAGSLIKLFEEAEIIFGSEQVLSYSLQEVMAYQTKILERIQKSKTANYFIDRIENETVHLYVARKKISHEKLYLLSSKEGKRRVITGSANMSQRAFKGNQRENIVYMDGDEAYDWYYEIYQQLKSDSSDEIASQALRVSTNTIEIDELPVSKSVQASKVLAIEPEKSLIEEVEFALDVTLLSKKFKPITPKQDRSGKILLAPTKIVEMMRKLVDEKEREKIVKKDFPQLILDIEKGKVELNGSLLELNPTHDEIKKDVDLFLYYMEGYTSFHGNYMELQSKYFEFANWFFVSPFMGVMRDMANRYNHNTLPYPIFGLIYGQSKAGKTSFLETLLKMMIGQKTRISAPDFTRKSIDGLRFTVKGAPIIVDDLTQTRFNTHAIETIKNDFFGMSEKMTDYPAVVISANEDVKVVAPEIVRRTITCRVQAGLTNTEVMRSNVVRKVQKDIKTAFYREYLRRMLPLVFDMVELMKQDEDEVNAPDILEASSRVICEILEEYSTSAIPKYFRKLTLEDYFSEKVTGRHARQIISTAWETDKNYFVINKTTNTLKYNAGQTWDAARIIKELPENLEARISREWVVMNLSEAQEFFCIKFRKSILSMIKK